MASGKTRVGIIAEDTTDVQTVITLIRRIKSDSGIGMRKFVGDGKGKIPAKCKSWAETLRSKGCTALLLMHDRDGFRTNDIMDRLKKALLPSPISNYVISIPVEEIEAWLLSDSEAIRKAFNLRCAPKPVSHPEDISDPKEYLEGLVRRLSFKKLMYLTAHNEKIAAHLNLAEVLRKCSSFGPFFNFVKALP